MNTDFGYLFGGESFLVPTQVVFNNTALPVQTLADSGALGAIFINTDRAIELARLYNTPLHPLPQPIGTSGFDGHTGRPITHVIILHLLVDGRRFPSEPMLVADLGKYDMILGKNWLAKRDIWLDTKNTRLIWPEDRNIASPIKVPGNSTHNSLHQEGYNQGNGPSEQQEQMERSESLPQKPEPHTNKKRKGRNSVARTSQSQGVGVAAAIDIALIGAAPFSRHLRKPGVEIFMTSLHEIECAIEDKSLPREFATEDWSNLPACYQEFKDVFSKQASDTLPPQRPCDHNIRLEKDMDPAQAIGHAPLYKQTREQLEAAKAYIIDNLQKGFIVPSYAPFASPILMARHPSTGKLRFCVDYRKLNLITRKDRYPLPLIDELMSRISGAKVFTKLDIRQGFHRIRMTPESEDLTTFRTRYGMFKYRVMPFGLTNGPSTFQRFINDTFMDYLDNFVTAFVDDLLIYSSNELEHKMHVQKVLERLRAAGLQASLEKCEFHVKRTKYLGFIISTDGIEVDPAKTDVIRGWDRPTTVKGVQAFLGFCNFYRRFIKNYSRIAKPLHQLTRTDAVTTGNRLPWDQTCELAFEELKERLLNAPVLAHYHPNRPARIETDASDGTIAGVLSQKDEQGDWHPIAFYSKTMTGPQQNYHIHDKELLAVVKAMDEWRPELEGLQREDRFDVYTDHRALEYFMTTKALNARQARWAEFLSQFYFSLRYRPGKQNTLADALSRPDSDSNGKIPVAHRLQTVLKPEVLDSQIRAELAPIHSPAGSSTGEQPSPIGEQPSPEPENSVLARVIQANREASSLAEWRSLAADSPTPWSLRDGLLLHNNRLVVPVDGSYSTLRAALLDEIHRQPSMAHPGRNKMRWLVADHYYWDGWRGDVDRYVSNCHDCRRAEKPRDRRPGPLKPLPVPARAWREISMDFRSFPKDKHGHDAVLVICCRLSKRTISIPCCKGIDARGLASQFLVHFYRHYGAPESIVSDRGPQFISAFWDEFCTILGVKLRLSTARHPETDGQTEIVNQHIAMRLRPYVNYYQDDWSEYLPMIDYAAAALRQESIGVSPFFASMGYEPRTSFSWQPAPDGMSPSDRMNRLAAADRAKRMEEIWDFVRGQMLGSQERQRRQADRRRREIDFDVGDHVWLSLRDYPTDRRGRALAPQQAGPFRILERVGNAYKLELPASMQIHPIFSPDKLRKAAMNPLPGQQAPEPEPLNINGEDEWEVDEILAVRKLRNRLEYRVRWVGYDEDLTWYPARNFTSAPHKIKDFHDSHPDRPGPPRRLNEWIKAWEAEEELAEHPDDNKPAIQERSGGRPPGRGG